MIDWNALIPAGVASVPLKLGTGHVLPDSRGELGQSVPPVPVKTESVPPQVGQAQASNGGAYSRFFASVPVVPLKKQGRGKEEEKERGAALAPQSFCANVDEKGNSHNEANPAAVLLLMAWARVKKATREERAALLIALEDMKPAEQVRHWHGVCVGDGLKPWHVLCLPASMSGADCTRCQHLTTRHEAIGCDRQQYHWACDLGYLILEHGRGTERVWIAPPECNSFGRWYPSDGR